MPQPTSQKIADALAAAPCAPEHEARRAEMVAAALQDHYHDMFGHSACPMTELHAHCQQIGLHEVAGRVRNGDFDATKEETEAWAASQEGQATFGQLVNAPSTRREVGELLRKMDALAHVVDVTLNGVLTETDGPTPRYGFALIVREQTSEDMGAVRFAANIPRASFIETLEGLLPQMRAAETRRQAQEAAEALGDAPIQGNA